MRIGVDLLGSDHAPAFLFSAILDACQQLANTTFVVFVTQAALESIWALPNISQALFKYSGSIEFHVVTDVIEMHDEPLQAIRQKKSSSLIIGIRLLKKRFLDAFVTAGNTGALITSATLSLPLLPGVKRIALMATLPTQRGYVAVIDVGGNVSCKAHHLIQFAQIGAAYQQSTQGIEFPRVGLLNIGVESKKGTSEVRQAYQILQEQMTQGILEKQKIRFIGNVEGREVFQGKADVLVTDGFTGNVLLKASEGASLFILQHLKQALQDISQEHKEKIFNYLKNQFDYEEYAGAILCGVDRVVVKCHGKTSPRGLLNGIVGAADLVKHGFIQQIKQQLITTMDIRDNRD